MVTTASERSDGSLCQFATGAVYTDRALVLAAIGLIEGVDGVDGLIKSLDGGNKVEAKQASAAIRLLEFPELTVDGKTLTYRSLGTALRKGDGRVRIMAGDAVRYVVWEMAVDAWPTLGDDAEASGRWYVDPKRWQRSIGD